jgi:hypothetical protein
MRNRRDVVARGREERESRMMGGERQELRWCRPRIYPRVSGVAVVATVVATKREERGERSS